MAKVRLSPNRRLETRLKRKLISMLADIKKSFKQLDKKIKFDDGISIGAVEESFNGVIDSIDREELKTWLNGFFVDVYEHVNSKLKYKGEFTQKEVELMSFFIVQTLELFEVAISDFTKDVSFILSKGLIEGESIGQISKQLIDKAGVARVRAETIAITQTANANSRFARETFRQMGIKKVSWSSAKDKRVRKCHLARNGIKYDPNKGCYSACDGRYLQTGQEVRCRCAMIIELF